VRTNFLAGFVTAGFLLSSVAFAADQPRKKSSESDEVAQAIAFERAKDAAAARQARIEARHSTVTHSNSDTDGGADRDQPKNDKSGEKQSKQQRKQD
jgi:hypothetical protein